MANKYYLKEERKKKALALIEENETKYKEEIHLSIKGSVVYRNAIKVNYKQNDKPIKVIVEDLTTDGAIKKYGDGCCALNFASFKYAGGGFVVGAMAQEEALCHASNLYNVIGDKRFEREYEWNRRHTNNGLYHNFGIFTPNIIFGDVKCDIITVASTNRSHNKDIFDDQEYNSALEDRIKFVLDMAEQHHEKILILGAFGCGVFKNDPYLVASMFKDLLDSKNYNFEKVIFAIPRGENLEAFKAVYK